MTVMWNAFLAVALSLALATPASAADKWTRVVTDHFETVGNATGYTVRRVAQTLEHFQEVLTSEVLRGGGASPSRMVVMVFKNDVSFEPYKPDGASKVSIGGLAFLGDDALVALDGDNLAFGLQTVLGVYGAQLSARAQPGAPLWVRAGIGEVYRTFEESKGGRGAILGRPDRDRVEALRTSTPMPLRTLVGLTETSDAMAPGYPQRRMVDAQHWALVHYLSFGPRSAQFNRYLADLRAGTAADAAFQAAFGNIDTLEAELVGYVRKFTFPAVEVVFEEKVKPTVPKEQTLSDADAESYLSYLLARTRHVEQAKARLERTLAATPGAARATAILGKLEVEGRNTERGLQLLERAATLAPDDGWVQSTLGQQLFVALARTTGPLKGESLEHTRSVLRRAAELNAGDFVAAAELGWLLLFNPADLTGATNHLSQAVKLAPGRDRYRLWLADALLRQHRFDEAQTYLGPLMGRGGTPEIRAEARRLLSTIAESQKRSRSDAASVPLPSSPPPATPGPPDTRAPSGIEGTSPGLSSVGPPALRRLQAGETQALGTFTNVDCSGGTIALTIDSEGRRLLLSTPQLADVEFITYRTDTPTTVGCGPVTPAARVLATYRVRAPQRDGTVGVVVAIELLPDGFTPR